jgi:hypothetical protein
MIKLVVGAATVEDLLVWQAQRVGPDEPWILRTRMTPKRAPELIDGGSIYRVFKGEILCRQRILEVNTVGEGGTARCQITLDKTVVRVAPTPRRAFQGWRYLDPKDAPPERDGEAFGDVPPELARKLREAGAG